MFVFNGTDYTIVIVPLLIGIGLFALQLYLCRKARRMAVKLIPVYAVALTFLLAICTACSHSTMGFWDLNSLMAIIFAIIGCCFAFFVGLAWIVHSFLKKHP